MFYFNLSIVLAFSLFGAGVFLFLNYRDAKRLEEKLAAKSLIIDGYQYAMGLLKAVTRLKDSEGNPVQPTYEEYRDTVNNVLGSLRRQP